MRRSLALAAGSALFLLMGARGLAHAGSKTDVDPRHGQWFLDPAYKHVSATGTHSISFRHTGPGGWENWGSGKVSIGDLEGLAEQDLASDAHPVSFRLTRDGGTFVCQGSIARGRGAGTYELILDPKFPAELKRRGIGAPTEAQQVRLVMANCGLALIDELRAQGYETPGLPMLLKMAEHGVNLAYVRGLHALGYRLGSLTQLVKARDHGVDPDFIRGMADEGFRNLPFETLLKARDHGVDPEFIATYRELGYKLSLDELISLRDHGVDGEFIGGMHELGYRTASLELLRSARNQGVDPEYVAEMAEVGFKGTPLPDLIEARNHGVDASFVRRVRTRNPKAGLDEIIALRDQGYGR